MNVAQVCEPISAFLKTRGWIKAGLSKDNLNFVLKSLNSARDVKKMSHKPKLFRKFEVCFQN